MSLAVIRFGCSLVSVLSLRRVTRPAVVIDWMTLQIGRESGNRWSPVPRAEQEPKKKVRSLLAGVGSEATKPQT